MGRAPCCDKEGLKKGPWTPEEDKILVDYIQSNGHGSWRSLPKLAGLLRCGKSCRLRWTNYLRPDIKRGPFTPEEQKSIIQLHGIVGNKWSTIAAQLPGRTDNEVKNYWNTHLKKRLVKMGIDPDRYSPVASVAAISGDTSSSPPSCSSPASAAATRHMAQWESARLEAEVRLSKESLLFSSSSTGNTTSNTVAGEEEVEVAERKETDFFLRIWNSEVGRAFRNKERAGAAGSSSSPATSSTAMKCKDEDEEEGVEQTGTTTTTSEEESYQMQLDFAALGVDDLLGFGSLFSNGQFCNFSLFDGGDHHHPHHLNDGDGDTSPLDDIDGFSKWEDHHQHQHQHYLHQQQNHHAIEESDEKRLAKFEFDL